MAKILIKKADQYKAIKIENRDDLVKADKEYSFGAYKEAFKNYVKEQKTELAAAVDEIFPVKPRSAKKVIKEEVKEVTFESLKAEFLNLCKNASDDQKAEISKKYDEAISFALEIEELAMIEKEEKELAEKQKELAAKKEALTKKKTPAKK